MALSAGGRSAATCSALKPPQEMPNMPTLPEHHFCRASQAITSRQSSCSCLAVFIIHQAIAVAIAAHVHADRGIAVAGEIGVRKLIAGRSFRRACDRAGIRAGLEPGSSRRRRASQIRAASWVPSERGMNRFSISFTLRGKDLATLMSLLMGVPREAGLMPENPVPPATFACLSLPAPACTWDTGRTAHCEANASPPW